MGGLPRTYLHQALDSPPPAHPNYTGILSDQLFIFGGQVRAGGPEGRPWQ
jgi:hypothetical protein